MESSSGLHPNWRALATCKIQFKKFVKAAAVKVLEKKFHPHLFRHHFATHWYEKGISDDAIRRLMGHASFTTTSRVYIHMEEDTDLMLRKDVYNHPLKWIKA